MIFLLAIITFHRLFSLILAEMLNLFTGSTKSVNNQAVKYSGAHRTLTHTGKLFFLNIAVIGTRTGSLFFRNL